MSFWSSRFALHYQGSLWVWFKLLPDELSIIWVCLLLLNLLVTACQMGFLPSGISAESLTEVLLMTFPSLRQAFAKCLLCWSLCVRFGKWLPDELFDIWVCPSLLRQPVFDLQKKEAKKKKKDKKKGKEEKKERQPFDRDRDLKVNKFDDAQRKAIIKKSAMLNSRFQHSGTTSSFLWTEMKRTEQLRISR